MAIECVSMAAAVSKRLSLESRERETSRSVLLVWHRCIMSCCSLLPLVADLCQRLKGLGSFLTGGGKAASSPGEFSVTPSIILADTELEA